MVKGGFLEGRVLSPEEAQGLATIEPREVLLAKMAGLAKAEMSRAAFMFNALQSRFLSLLDAYKQKLPGEQAAIEEPVEEAAAVEEPADEPAAVEAAPEAEAGAAPEAEAPEEAEPASEAEAAPDETAGTSPAPQEETSEEGA